MNTKPSKKQLVQQVQELVGTLPAIVSENGGNADAEWVKSFTGEVSAKLDQLVLQEVYPDARNAEFEAQGAARTSLLLAGEALFGDGWQGPMYKMLGFKDNRKVRGMLAGTNWIPVGIIRELMVAIENFRNEVDEQLQDASDKHTLLMSQNRADQATYWLERALVEVITQAENRKAKSK